MANISKNFQAFEDRKDHCPFPVKQTPSNSLLSSYEAQKPKEDLKQPETKPSWRSLFAFTTRQHATIAAGAVVASIFSGLIRPTSAIIFGKLFGALTDYGARNVNSEELLHKVSIWCMGLALLGVATWIVEAGFFSLWLIFGELQAKCARQKMFSGMLDKNMEWYDLHEDGVASLLSRIET